MAFSISGIWFYVVTILLILLTTILYLLKGSLAYWKRYEVDTDQPKLFFGNVLNIILQKEGIAVNIKKFYDQMKSKGKKYGGYYFLFRPIFVPIDLDLIKNMCINDFAHFTDHIGHVDEERDPISTNMFTEKGARWKNIRAKLTPAFTPGKIKMMFENIRLPIEELTIVIDKMALQQEPIDIKDIAERYTIDNIVTCAFGIECNSLKDPHHEFLKHSKTVFGSSFKQALQTVLIVTFSELFSIFKIRMFEKSVTDFFMDLVRKTVKQREENNDIRKDFMHLLLQIRNNVQISESEVGDLKKSNDDKSEKLSLSLNDVGAQCFVFFMAGYETSATTAAFCLFELALNQNLQEKVRSEANATFEKYGGFTYEAIMKMTYLENCVNETLRKYPPLPITTRVCTKTYKIPNTNVVINKGMHVFIPIYGIHMDPDFFPNPEIFDPDRFENENGRNRHPAAWEPFGLGPRMCPGFRFGIVEIKLAVAVLVQRYKLSVSSKTKLPLKFNPRQFIPNAASKILLNAQKL